MKDEADGLFIARRIARVAAEGSCNSTQIRGPSQASNQPEIRYTFLGKSFKGRYFILSYLP